VTQKIDLSIYGSSAAALRGSPSSMPTHMAKNFLRATTFFSVSGGPYNILRRAQSSAVPRGGPRKKPSPHNSRKAREAHTNIILRTPHLPVRSFSRSCACPCARVFVPWRQRPPVRSHHGNIAETESTYPPARSYALLFARLLVCTHDSVPSGLPLPRLSLCPVMRPFCPSLARLFTRHLACSPVFSLTRSPVCLFDRSSSRHRCPTI
jgi:hypothetical protein